MEIHIDRSSQQPLYRQIARQIAALIGSGGLPAGFRLPPERRLADGLGVNRSTILAAYRELKDGGLVDARVGRGTVVLDRPPAAVPAADALLPWQQILGDAHRAEDPLLRDLLSLTERSDAIMLSIGLPAPDLLPVAALGRALAAVLHDAGAAVLTHSPTEGHTPLRESIADLLASRGIRCSAADVLVVSGSQQGLDLVARLLLSPGDTVIVEEPSYFGALQVFRAAGARILAVGADAQGMRVDALESLLARTRPKLIYTLPTFQNPSGHVMPLERRRRLIEVACAHQVPVLEDDSYFDLRYQGEAIAPIKALDPHGCVLYLSTFSKVLLPGLRLGWIVAPRPVLRRLALVKQAVDLHSNTPGQWALDRLLRDGFWSPHVRALRTSYGAKRDAMVTALAATAPALRWRTPHGGFYLWVELPAGTSRQRLLAEAGAAGVSFLPGAACFVSEPGAEFARLNFTYPSLEQVREGIARLSVALARVAADPAPVGGEVGATRPIV